MAESDLNIILKLVDQASAGIKKAFGEVKKENDDLKKKSDESSASIQEGFKKAGQEVRQFRNILLPVTISIAGIAAASKVWAESNLETRDSFRRIEDGIRILTGQIGSLFAPAISALSDIIKENTGALIEFFDKVKQAYKGFAEDITFATQFWVAFLSSVRNGSNITDATTDSLKIAGQAAEEMGQKFEASFKQNIPDLTESRRLLDDYANKLKEIDILFVSGKISSTEYYQNISNLLSQQIALNQAAAQQMRDLANITVQVSNRQILEAQRLTTEQINLLNVYKQNYMTAHSGIAAFTATIAKSIQTNMSAALTGIITGAKTAKDAFADLGKAMIQAIVEFMAQKVVAWVLEKTLLAGTVAASSTAAAAIAAAWAPAAALVSAATFGASAAAGAAALTAAAGVATGIAATSKLGIFQGGDKAGLPFDTVGTNIQNSNIPKFADGGIVTRPTLAIVGESGPEAIVPLNRNNQSSASTGDIYISVNYPRFNTRDDIDEMAKLLGLKIQQELKYARGI